MWPVRPRARFPWKTTRKKVPYEGCARRSHRAGKTRTALLETRKAKSMRVNDKNSFLLQNFVLFKTSDESEHSESEFYYPGELSDAELLQSPTYSESTERKSTLLTNEKVHNFLRSQQASRRSRKQLFRMNCPIINLWNKQTVLRRNFFLSVESIKEFIVGQKQENRNAKKKKYDISSSSFQSFWEKLVKPEKSQTYLAYSRINCSAVSTSVLFEETKLSTTTSSLPYILSR